MVKTQLEKAQEAVGSQKGPIPPDVEFQVKGQTYSRRHGNWSAPGVTAWVNDTVTGLLDEIALLHSELEEKQDEWREAVTDFFKKAAASRRREFMSHVSAECLLRVEQPDRITLQEWDDLAANSYERRLMYPRLTDEALVGAIENCLKNSTYRVLGKYEVGSTYEDILIGVLLPELLKRFQNKEKHDAGTEQEA